MILYVDKLFLKLKSIRTELCTCPWNSGRHAIRTEAVQMVREVRKVRTRADMYVAEHCPNPLKMGGYPFVLHISSRGVGNSKHVFGSTKSTEKG